MGLCLPTVAGSSETRSGSSLFQADLRLIPWRVKKAEDTCQFRPLLRLAAHPDLHFPEACRVEQTTESSAVLGVGEHASPPPPREGQEGAESEGA